MNTTLQEPEVPTYTALADRHARAMAEWHTQANYAISYRKAALESQEAAEVREAQTLLGKIAGVVVEGRNAAERDASLKVLLVGDVIYDQYHRDAIKYRELADLAQVGADQARAEVRWCEASLPLLDRSTTGASLDAVELERVKAELLQRFAR